jgi:hypothetical protein
VLYHDRPGLHIRQQTIHITTQQKFLMTSLEEHKQKSIAQIKSWLNIHYKTMQTNIQQNKIQQHPDNPIAIRTQNSIQVWPDSVPCEAYKALILDPLE